MNKLNRKGFTLIELLAVVIILGVIMTIAVPNVLSMLDRNKRETFIEHAKTMVNQAEYTLRKDTSIDYPENNGDAIILTLEYLNTDDIKESPYNTEYSLSKSFVAIVNKTEGGVTEYEYYVHLVACTDIDCNNTSDNSVNKNRGINLVKSSYLDGQNLGDIGFENKFALVQEGKTVEVSLFSLENNGDLSNDTLEYIELVTGELNDDSVKVFNKLS